MFGEDLHNRTMSGFPISISTSLALESLFKPRQATFDPDRVPPPMVDISPYQEIWFNMSTLYRNVMSSATKDQVQIATPAHVADVLEQEMEIIDSLFANEGQNRCKPRFYVPDYSKILNGAHKSIQFRHDNTPAQQVNRTLWNNAIDLLDRRSEWLVRLKGVLTPFSPVSAMVLTHVPYDLLGERNFRRLDLLESHTGKLKSKRLWNTKYYPVGKHDLSHLPFMKTLLYILGDRVLIHPGPLKLREMIVQAGLKRNWTSATTRDKVLMDLELEIKEPYVVQMLKSI